MRKFSEFLEESSSPERGRRRLSPRGPKKDRYQRGIDKQKTSDKIAVKKAGFKTGPQDGPHGSFDHYHSSSRHHSTNIASHKTQADYALSTVDRKYDRFSSSRRVEPTSSRVSGLKKIRRLLKTTRTARPVHDISIHSDESGISKNDPTRLISRGKSFKKERMGVPDALQNAGAKTGDFAVGEPYGSMPHENPETGKKTRARLYGKDYGVSLDKRTGKMVGRVKTFEQFMIESQEVLNRISRNYSKRYRGVNVDVSHDPKTNSIRVNQLFVPPHLQGQGIGTRVMKGLGNYADRINHRITLTQDPDKGKKAKLQKFYKSHGFEPNRGRNRDFTTRDTHIRQPKKDT